MLNLVELFQTFNANVTTENEGKFSAIPIPGCEQHRLGRDYQGKPLLLISIRDFQIQNQPTPIVLEHLKVLYNLKCRVSRTNDTVEEGLFTVVHCTGEDSTLQTYFLRVASSIILSLKNQPTQSDVTHAINQLIELFRAMTKPPRKSVQGLWAELFLISQAHQPATLVNAWHTEAEDLYDFARGNQRLEVKSFSGDIRQHHFSLEQLHPPNSVKTLVASVFVKRSQVGESIADLRKKVHSLLGSNLDLLLHIDTIIALTLGDSWHHASEARFDEELAKRSLAFYEVSAIPTINPNLPLGVNRVHFQSDLTDAPMVEISSDLKDGMFGAVLC